MHELNIKLHVDIFYLKKKYYEQTLFLHIFRTPQKVKFEFKDIQVVKYCTDIRMYANRIRVFRLPPIYTLRAESKSTNFNSEKVHTCIAHKEKRKISRNQQ